MRVLTIINSLGDSGQYFIPFFEGIVNRGHHLLVVSIISDLMRNKLSRLGIDYVDLSHVVQNMGGLYFIESLVRFPFRLAKIMKIINSEKIDLIHVHHPFMPLLFGCMVSKIKKIPIVLTIHGGPPSLARRLSPICQAHRITATSLEQTKGLPKCNKDIVVVPLPIDLKRFSPHAYSSTMKIDAYKKIVLICRLDPDKISVVYSVIESAPKIWKAFGNAQVIIAGDGSEAREVKEVTRKMNKEMGKEVIVLTGFVEDTPKLMRLADIVIGVGVVVAEAMACGKPVIVAGSLVGSRGGSFGGIITDQNIDELRRYNFSGRNSNVRTDVEKIFTSVSTLLQDEQYMNYLGAFGRRYVENEFEPEKIAKQVELVYTSAQEDAINIDNFPSVILAGWAMLGIILYQFVNKVLTIVAKSLRCLPVADKLLSALTSSKSEQRKV